MNDKSKYDVNFLFYDYETFGLHPSLDKPAQFAYIKTDFNFRYIDSNCFYCYPPLDYLPDPLAVLTHRITPQYTMYHGTNEFFFSRKIFNIFDTKNTCVIGYNNLNFDDEFTRNIFYRNFLDPYSWSWKNNNSRWDVIKIIQICYILSPQGIIWPKNSFNFISFKLSDLTIANNIYDGNAHDALSDVHSTINLMNLIKCKKPELFYFFFKYRLKSNLRLLINVTEKKPIIYVPSIFGKIKNKINCIIPILWNRNNSNMLFFFDLHMDANNLINYLSNTDAVKLNMKKIIQLGVNFLYINQCPILIPVDVLNDYRLLRLKINLSLYNNKIFILKKNLALINKINICFENYYSNYFKRDVDLMLYESFVNSYDSIIMDTIHNTKINHLKNVTFNFNNYKLYEMFFRLKARNFPELLNNLENKKWFNHRFNIFHLRYFNKYLLKLNALKNYNNQSNLSTLLNDLKNHYYNVFL